MKRIDYDGVASACDRRYRDGGPAGLAAFVRERCWTEEVIATGSPENAFKVLNDTRQLCRLQVLT
jgi:hypothetical protein